MAAVKKFASGNNEDRKDVNPTKRLKVKETKQNNEKFENIAEIMSGKKKSFLKNRKILVKKSCLEIMSSAVLKKDRRSKI